MRKIIFAITAGLVLLICSCGKDNTPAGIPVRYLIQGADNYITQINYTDSLGNPHFVNDTAGFNGGDLTIHVLQTPFYPTLGMTVNNIGPSTKYYTLAIYVNGTVTKYTNFAVPPNAINTSAPLKDTIQ